MKKLLLLLILPLLFSCVGSDEKKTNSDLTIFNLNGPVKTIKGYSYYIEEKFGEKEEKKLNTFFIYSFNKNGNLIEKKTFKHNDFLEPFGYMDPSLIGFESSSNYKYNEEGKLIEKDVIDFSKTWWRYKYDYDYNERIKTEKKYDSDGNLEWAREFKYNKYGELIEELTDDFSGYSGYEHDIYIVWADEYNVEYNDDGLVVKKKHNNSELGIDFFEYTFDSKKNWIYCIAKKESNGFYTTKKYKRDIEYYE